MAKRANEKARWTASDMPSQIGRRVVITGTGGLAYECALQLARAGAEVILAGRNRNNGEASIATIRSSIARADIQFEQLDLADLSSVHAFGKRMQDRWERLDVLINNAAVMTVPRRQTTKDGFELQFGTNYLGHFAVTAHLIPLLRHGKDPRVVNVCALAANSAAINFDNLQYERNYRPMPAYGQSKLANLIFSLELHRRSGARNLGVKSIAAHPGLARTDLAGARMNRTSESALPLPLRLLAPLLLQPADRGALPPLFAATAPEAESGGYYGPDGRGERKGFPAPARIPSAATDPLIAQRLWEMSVQLTNVDFTGT